MLTLLSKGVPTKLLKFIWLKIFFICHRCQRHRWSTLSCEYLRDFWKKFEMVLMEYSGAGGKLIHKKTRSKKSRDTVPLSNINFSVCVNVIYLVVCRCCYITTDPETCESENGICLERLDQGHLHPELEVPGLTCPGRESIGAGEASHEWNIAQSWQKFRSYKSLQSGQ